jgi:hypothetical protein
MKVFQTSTPKSWQPGSSKRWVKGPATEAMQTLSQAELRKLGVIMENFTAQCLPTKIEIMKDE